MKRTALVAAAALLVTMGSTMAFAGISDRMETEKFNQMVKEYRTEMRAKYLTNDQVTVLGELGTTYVASVSDLVEETKELRSEIANLEDDQYPDYAAIDALEMELWEKMGQLTEAKKSFENEAKTVNATFPFAVKVF